MLGDAFRGATYFWRGLDLLRKPKIRLHAFMPIALSAVVFGALAWLGVSQLEPVVAAAESTVPDWLSWVGTVLWVLFALAFILVTAFCFVIVASLIACPFNGLLAEAVERHLSGREPPSLSVWKTLLRLPGTLVQETKKLLYFVFWAIPFLLFFLIPPVNVAAPILWVVFSSWMLALEMTDYPMDNGGLAFGEMRRRLRTRVGTALGFGAMTFFVATIPIVNLIAIPAGVAGATVFWVRELREAA